MLNKKSRPNYTYDMKAILWNVCIKRLEENINIPHYQNSVSEFR